jgi:hypothetical protein
MIWATAFEQEPAGSLPNSHALIAAHMEMDARIFSAHADILLRGFYLCSDDRLYHPAVVERVTALLGYRNSERERKENYRKRMKTVDQCPIVVPWDRRGKDAGRTAQEQEQEQEQDKDKDTNVSSSAEPADPPRETAKNCPQNEIIDLYHARCPTMPKVRTWTGQRPKLLRNRWNEHPDLEWWDGFLAYCSESRFLTGRAPATDNSRPPFVADLEWLIRPSNFQRINEGKYHR